MKLLYSKLLQKTQKGGKSTLWKQLPFNKNHHNLKQKKYTIEIFKYNFRLFLFLTNSIKPKHLLQHASRLKVVRCYNSQPEQQKYFLLNDVMLDSFQFYELYSKYHTSCFSMLAE